MAQVLILFLLILVGVVVKKIGVVSDHMNKEVSSLVINVCLPAFILHSMQFDFSPDVLLASGQLIGISFGVYALSMVVSALFVRLIGAQGVQRNVYQYVGIFANVGFMGYPVINAFAGELGVFYAAVYNLAFSVLVWSYGVALMSRRVGDTSQRGAWHKNLKKLVNPALVAVTIGFVLFAAGLRLPYAIDRTLGMIGGATTPLSMMFIGFILAEVHPSELIRYWRDFAVSGLRLLLMPATVYLLLTQIGFTGAQVSVPVLLTAMPAAANTAIIANRYNADDKLASRIVFISTTLSMGTIPLVLQWIPPF